MTKKISVNNLIIEITRKCNMNCEHCLRGNSQNIDVNFEHVEKLFSQIDYISTLSFGGGEPVRARETIVSGRLRFSPSLIGCQEVCEEGRVSRCGYGKPSAQSHPRQMPPARW